MKKLIRDYNAVIAGIEEDWLCSEGGKMGWRR